MVALCRGILVLAAVLMLATLWLTRQKRKLAAGILAALALSLGLGGAARLATWKEPTQCEKYLAAAYSYDQAATRKLAGIIRQQYPRHQVVVLLPPGIKTSGPGPQDGTQATATAPHPQVASLAAALGPQIKTVGACLKADDRTLDELMSKLKRSQPQLTRPMVQQFIGNYLEDWYSGRHFLEAIGSTGLTGDIVVVSFAGMPREGLAEIKAAGHPVLLPPPSSGARTDAAKLVGDGIVTAAVLARPGRSNELWCPHNPDKAFAHRWFLLTPATLAEAKKLPGLFNEDDLPVAIVAPAVPVTADPLQKKN